MEPEGSIPRPQEPATGLYPKPDQCSPHDPILFIIMIMIMIIIITIIIINVNNKRSLLNVYSITK
jgi:hypothetical protein